VQYKSAIPSISSFNKCFNKYYSLKICHCNVNSVSNKLDYILDVAQQHSLDIFGVTESWLLPSVRDSFVEIAGYRIVRTDAFGEIRKHGVCFYVKSGLVFVSVDVEVPNVHVVNLVDFELYVVLVYRPPSNSVDDDKLLVNFLFEFCLGREVLIMGDFNLPMLDWADDIVLQEMVGETGHRFANCFNVLGLTQWVHDPTFLQSGNILDIVLTTEDDRVGDVEVLAPFPHCGHCPVYFTYWFLHEVQENGTVSPRRAWHRGKFSEINEHLSDIDWVFEFQERSVNDMFSRFQEIICSLVERYVPLWRDDLVPRSSVRIPAGLRNERRVAWLSYKSLRRQFGRHSGEALDALEIYSSLNLNFRNFHINAKISHEESLVATIRESPKRFHSYIRTRKVGTPSVGPLRLQDGVVSSDCGVMSELFADAFSSVYVENDPIDPAPHRWFDGSIDTVPLQLPIVHSKLADLDAGTSMGPDGIHASLLKACRETLSYPLFLLFKKSLDSGTLPDVWRESLIVPLYKRGSRLDPLNYRPISLTSVCCKTMERIIVDGLNEYFDVNGLLSEDQFGFRSGRSVEDQLLLTYDSVSLWLDDGFGVDVILFDFAKAFDVVNHGIILDKLRNLGVCGTLLSWIECFLRGRIMSVAVSGISSQSRSVKSGVPQGSVLGPFLFLVYVDYLPSAVRCKCKFFADDLKLYLRVRHGSVHTMATDISGCQRDIDIVCKTAASWGLTFSAGKCVLLRFERGRSDWNNLGPLSSYYMGNRPIDLVDNHRDLGVIVDNSLRFHTHIASIVNKAGGLAANLLRSTLCRSPDFMMTLFSAHLRPLLEFSSCVWNTGFIGDLRLLESVQRRWTRQIDGLGELHYASRLAALDMYSVKGRLLRADMIKCWKIFHDECIIGPNDIFVMAEQIGTRGHMFKIAHVHTSLECRKRFFSVRCIASWNSLPCAVVSAGSVGSFKSGLHDALGPALYDYCD
jgi:hypothetical protein